MTRTLLTILALSAAVCARAEWSTFHGNNQRNGLTSVVGPAQPRVLWSFDIGGAIITSPVVGPAGTVYVGTTWEDKKKPRQFLTAVNPDGTLKWRFETPWIDDQTMATPAVGPDGKIYFGTATGAFICVDAAGVEQWRYQAQQPVLSHTLVASDGNVYVQLDSKLTSFTPTGTLRWQQPVDHNYPGGPTETLQGRILIGGDVVRCFNTNGTSAWVSDVFTTMAPVIVSPNGDVIVGGSSIMALDPNTGTVKWNSFIYAYGTYASPSVDAQGNVYYGFDYDLYKVSSTGTFLIHEYLADPNSNFLGHTWSSAAVDGAGHLFWGMGSGKRSAIPFEKNLMVLNTSLIATFYAPLPHITGTSNPALASNGVVYVGCLDGRLYALGN